MAGADQPPDGERQPFFQTFSPRDYHADTLCRSIVQDSRGLMYIANHALVLEYDGSSWRKVPVAKEGWINALAYEASTDTVFVGGDRILGYLKVVPGGERVFVSLLDQLPADARAINSIHSVHSTPGGIFFLAENRVLRWSGGHFKSWPLTAGSAVNRPRGGWASGNFYVQNPDAGLPRLENEAFVAASDDPLLHRASVRAVLTGANTEVLIGTEHDGLFTLHDRVLRPWEGLPGGFLKEKGIHDCALLRDGSLAIATASVGLVLLDKQGRFRNHVDEAGGLHGGNLYGLCEDAEGGLWIGLQTGVMRAEIDSPLSILRAGPGDDLSNMFCGDQWFGSMVLGNYTGLYRLVGPDGSTVTGAHLERLPGITDTFFGALPVENGLLLSAEGKIALLDADAHLTTVFTTKSSQEFTYPSRQHPGEIYVGEENGHVSALKLMPRPIDG